MHLVIARLVPCGACRGAGKDRAGRADPAHPQHPGHPGHASGGHGGPGGPRCGAAPSAELLVGVLPSVAPAWLCAEHTRIRSVPGEVAIALYLRARSASAAESLALVLCLLLVAQVPALAHWRIAECAAPRPAAEP